MERTIARLVAAITVAVSTSANAATFSAAISDQSGRPVSDAVIMLLPDDKAGMPTPVSRLGGDKTVDQRDEKFIPLVTIVPRGSRVTFTNNDNTMHQVYSFSAVKQFEITLAHKQVAPGLIFDKAGVAAIGCNIHDHMIAFIFVSDSPWTARTEADGHMEFVDLPPGNYTAQVWHNRIAGGVPLTTKVTVGANPTTLTTKINLIAEQSQHRRHGGGY